MSEPKLNITVEELARFLRGPLRGDWAFSEEEKAAYEKQACRMLAAGALYEAGKELLRIADATDCDAPATEQFDMGKPEDENGYQPRLNDSLGEAQFAMKVALALAEGKENQ